MTNHLLIIGRVDPLSVLVLTTRVASPLLRSPSNTCKQSNIWGLWILCFGGMLQIYWMRQRHLFHHIAVITRPSFVISAHMVVVMVRGRRHLGIWQWWWWWWLWWWLEKGEFSIPGSMACSAAQDGNAEDIIPIKRTIITTTIITTINHAFVVLFTCGCSGTVV